MGANEKVEATFHGAQRALDPRDALASRQNAADALRAYQAGEWCGECRFGVVDDPPCCTQPDAAEYPAAAAALRREA